MQSRAEEVDFVVCGLDDDGRPSQAFLQATEVALVNENGKELGRFKDAASLGRFLFKVRGKVKLIALDTTGLPRLDLVGKYCCYEQGYWDSMTQPRRP
jgi:hypothetical protein